MAIFRIEEYYAAPDGRRTVLGSYQIPDTDPEKVAALLEVLSAADLRGGGYATTAVYLNEEPVTIRVDEHNKLVVDRVGDIKPTSSTPEATLSATDGHTISIHESYTYPDGRRETFGLYRIRADDRRRAAAILEVASARRMRAGGYGEVSVYLDGKPVDARIDEHDELQLTPAGGPPEPPTDSPVTVSRATR